MTLDTNEIGILLPGRRNDTLARLGGYLRRKGWERPAIESELLRQNLRRCRPALPEDEIRAIAASVSRYPTGGPDPLEQAWKEVQAETHESRYARFASLVCQLQRIRSEYPVVLPLKRIAALMGCAWESVRGYRKDAVATGLLYKVADPTPHRRAAEYRVTLPATPTPTATPDPITTIATIPTIGLVVTPHGGNREVTHGGNSHSGNGEVLGSHGGNALEGESWEQVVRLATRGFRLFPCRPQSKIPHLKAWQKVATSDVAQLGQWFQKYPGANWAIATGAGSRVFVLDIDGDAGLSTLHQLVAEHSDEPQPDTLGVKTSRGFHLYFHQPGDGRIPNSIGTIGLGLDIRGDGGYAVCPPSLHPSGAAYEWLGGREDRPVQAAPLWLLARIAETRDIKTGPAAQHENISQIRAQAGGPA